MVADVRRRQEEARRRAVILAEKQRRGEYRPWVGEVSQATGMLWQDFLEGFLAVFRFLGWRR